MKLAAAKIKNLAIDIAVILGLAMGAIALATHGLNTKFPSLF
jgi:orotate phosphoribosyltransferase